MVKAIRSVATGRGGQVGIASQSYQHTGESIGPGGIVDGSADARDLQLIRPRILYAVDALDAALVEFQKGIRISAIHCRAVGRKGKVMVKPPLSARGRSFGSVFFLLPGAV